MNRPEILRRIPAIDQLLHSRELAPLRERYGHATLVAWARQAADELRQSIDRHAGPQPELFHAAMIESVLAAADADCQHALRPVINATGIILHTNLGRAPLASTARQQLLQAAGYTNLELDLGSGKRSHRGQRVTQLLKRLTGAEDALVVNNCAAATLLALQGTALGREVVISRGQLVEIGGGFRLPDVFRAAGVSLKEIGTTNRTYLRDYQQAIGEQTGAVMRVHRSNFAQIGFVTEPNIEDLATLKPRDTFALIDDLGSGCLYDLSPFGLSEPTLATSLAAGADLCLFSGDKLFGGPQCGMLVGRAAWIARLRSSPLLRAVRADKVTLAALEATVEIHVAGRAFEQLPTLRMLAEEPSVIRERCTQLIDMLAEPIKAKVAIVACQSEVGGGTLPGQTRPSWGLSIDSPQLDDIAQRLRVGRPAILGRLLHDRLLLDLRTVAPCELDAVAQRLNALLTPSVGERY